MVVTFPAELRSRLTKTQLEQFQVYCKRYFCETLGYTHGELSWHWCGDDGETKKPHLNILFPEKFLSPEKLASIKQHLSAEICKLTCEKDIQCVVHYGYYEKIKQALHKWRYVCRPTWRVYSDEINEIAFNYRNIRWWGDFKNKVKDNVVDKVEKMSCPFCDGRLKSCKALGLSHHLARDEWVHFGAGNYFWRYYINKGNSWAAANYL